ncbi:MAG: pitrilysin family protein [Byssovorax sp.]
MRARDLLCGGALAALSILAGGCDQGDSSGVVVAIPGPTAKPVRPKLADPLGPKPKLDAPRAFTPPAPAVLRASNGLTIWLLERHTLPLVSARLVVPAGSAVDPEGRAGLAHITADMMDEGAGSRNAVELSTAVTDLGASLETGNGADGSFVALSSLKKNFAEAFGILADVVARPRFDKKEWERTADLWKNDLKKRSQDPMLVSRVVARAVLYGPNAPYGHPPDGRTEGAKAIKLDDVKAFYAERWRPDQATLVVSGDMTKDELVALVESALGSWKAPAAPPPEPPAGLLSVQPNRPRLVLVDRPDAPQSVIAVVREGVKADAPEAPLLSLVNTALGGSFTSRLNQNLREDHGWTYGARSYFGETRGLGMFTAGAAVVTEATGKALAEMQKELAKMAAAGLSDVEVGKVKAQDRADLMQTYEGVGDMAGRLATLAMLGLPPGFDGAASASRQKAAGAELAALAARVDPKASSILVIGPKDAVIPQLAAIDLRDPEIWDAEGFPKKTARK